MKYHNLNSYDFDMDEIESIELIGEHETIDITVDDTHMFYANDIYTHNSANNVDIITGDYVAESYKKIMTADFVVSVSRKIEDKLASTARYHVIKNRYGFDGITFPAKINVAIGKIEMHAPNSVDGVKTNKEMSQSSELVRQKLAQKFKEFESEE